MVHLDEDFGSQSLLLSTVHVSSGDQLELQIINIHTCARVPAGAPCKALKIS